ncbi:alpha/beta hydrolase fold domain-containing protein, partial [Gluconacetobacter sacchari]
MTSPPLADPPGLLDPEIAAFRRHMAMAGQDFPPFETLPPDAARALAAQARATLPARRPAVAHVGDIVIEEATPPLRARIFSPGPAAEGVLVYLHGGGWTLFGLDTHDRLMREYAVGANLAVVGLDYALAPEHVFPVALEQVMDCLRALPDHLGPLADLPLFVGGDSAGANLSLAAAIGLRDAGAGLHGRLRGLLLSYGVYDSACDTPSYTRFAGPDFMLTRDEMLFFWQRYIPDAARRALPLASPLRADLAGLPPVFMTIAECDVLADENHAMADRLRAAGNAVTARSYPGATHSFLEALDVAGLAARAVGDQIAWLRARRPGRGGGMTLRRGLFLAHRYAGLGIALFLMLAAATGTALVFRDRADAALNPGLFRVPAGPVRPAAELMARVLAAHPSWRVVRFDLRPRSGSALRAVMTRAPGAAPEDVFIDPRDGRVTGTRTRQGRPDRAHAMQLLYDLHDTLALGNAGRLFMGSIAACWLALTVAGLVVTLPRRRPLLA